MPKSFTHKMAAKASWHWNYVTITLCIIMSMLTWKLHSNIVVFVLFLLLYCHLNVLCIEVYYVLLLCVINE